MKVIIAITIFFAAILLSVALLNLLTLFDDGRCACSTCAGKCVLQSEVPKVCVNKIQSKINCQTDECKYLFRGCRKLPKVLNFRSYLLAN